MSDDVNRDALVSWRCPGCHGELDGSAVERCCRSCGRRYPVVAGIPDFRIALAAWVDVDTDRANAVALDAVAPGRTPGELVERVFAQRGWTSAEVERRTRQILEGPERLTRELDQWLAPIAWRAPFLDLGCGAGPLLAATARRGHEGVGVDVMLEWLVVARALISAHGGRPVLAAAMAEALPLADRSLPAIVALDVFEHVGDQRRSLREIDRTLVAGGAFAFATPNRFSLAPEPHVGVWGVGWLPRRWQAPYATWRSGMPYEYCRLVGQGEVRRMMQDETHLVPRFLVPPVPEEELARFRGGRALAARVYNGVIGTGPGRALVQPICPFFRVVATKAAT